MHGVIQEQWNVIVIKRMHKQCVPGSLSLPLESLGTRLLPTLDEMCGWKVNHENFILNNLFLSRIWQIAEYLSLENFRLLQYSRG